jgi:hypothetical protein
MNRLITHHRQARHVAGQKEEDDMQMHHNKSQWKALYSAFRAARYELRYEREDGWTVLPHADVAAVHAAATSVEANRVRAGFALRHAGKLPRVWVDAGLEPRVMDPGLEARLWWARRWPGEPCELPEEVLPPVMVEAAA